MNVFKKGVDLLRDVFNSMRPKQWTKNILVFAGLFFAEDMSDLKKIVPALLAFVFFCMVSSGGYLINDVVDRKKDAQHPRKKFRPIAAGKVPVAPAIGLGLFLLSAGIGFSFYINRPFGILVAFYSFFTLSYSFFLKQVIILDVLVIASGFVLRAIGGTLAINEVISSWLIVCTIFLSLFLALTKRRSEFVALGDDAATVRKTLAQYTTQFLDQMINTVTSACLISYALYTLDAGTVAKFGTRNLAFTLPLVIYGLFRYLYLVHHHNAGESPETAIFQDAPIIFCILLYIATVAAIIYW
jgi:4-hydroxybenzoate polyprenyltransferase